jgi:hypothetical protein
MWEHVAPFPARSHPLQAAKLSSPRIWPAELLLLESDQAAELLPLIFSNNRANPHQTASESFPKQPSRGARTEGMQEARGVTEVLSRNHYLGKGS